MEEHIAALTARRDHLLAVNARLSMPLTPLNNPHQAKNSNPSLPGSSPGDAGGMSGLATLAGVMAGHRPPRMNNVLQSTPPTGSGGGGGETITNATSQVCDFLYKKYLLDCAVSGGTVYRNQNQLPGL